MAFRRNNRVLYRKRDGTVVFDLPDHLRELFGTILGELREMLLADATEDLRRLYPTAYPDDEKLDADYQRLMKDDLLEGRLAALDTVEASLHNEELTDDELGAWMGSVNSLRLVLGTRLDVSEDMTRVDDDDPRAPMFALYELLSMLLTEIVDVMSGGIKP